MYPCPAWFVQLLYSRAVLSLHTSHGTCIIKNHAHFHTIVMVVVRECSSFINIIGVIVQDKGISIYVHGTSTVSYAMCIITADFIKINCNSSKS